MKTLDHLRDALSAVMEAQRAAEAKQKELNDRVMRLRPESKYQRTVKRDLEDEIEALNRALRDMHEGKMKIIALIGEFGKSRVAGWDPMSWLREIERDIRSHPEFVELHNTAASESVAAALVEYSTDHPGYEGGFRVEVYGDSGELLIETAAPRGARTRLTPFLREGERLYNPTT